MKRKLMCLLLVFVMVFIVGCAAKDDTGKANGDLEAKTFTPQQEYAAGTLFQLQYKNYFENIKTTTIFTANMGVVEDDIFELLLTEGVKNIEIKAQDGNDVAELKFSLNVVNAGEQELTNKEYYEQYKVRAVSYGRLIYEKYWVAAEQRSTLVPGSGKPFLWPYGEIPAMCSSILNVLDEDEDIQDYQFFKSFLENSLEGFRYYRIKKTTGYTTMDYGQKPTAVSSYSIYNAGANYAAKDNGSASKGSVYFDDNIWVAKEFINAYKVLGDKKYLYEGLSIVNWILGEGYESSVSAEGDFSGTAMNGIYWNWGVKDTHDSSSYNDSKTASLNSCSSAPTAMMLFDIVNLFNSDTDIDVVEMSNLFKADYLQKAKNIVLFMHTILYRSQDGVYSDKIYVRANDKGQLFLEFIDTFVLPYNTGCMLTAFAKGSASVSNYAKIGVEVAKKADNYFKKTNIVQGQNVYPKNSWFTVFLLEGFIDLYNANIDKDDMQVYIKSMQSSLDYGYKYNKDSDGLVCPAWVEGWSAYADNSVSENNPRQILLQSANAHSYALIAGYYL